MATLYRIEGKVIEAEPLMKKAEDICAKHGRKGANFLGIQTEALFNDDLKELEASGVPPKEIRMEVTGGRLCDLNLDGVCDATDLAIFKASLGTCWKDDGYNSLADIDADGCVTTQDQRALFPDTLKE